MTFLTGTLVTDASTKEGDVISLMWLDSHKPIYIFRKELDKLVKEDLLEIDEDKIKLTNKGLDLANIVWEEFI